MLYTGMCFGIFFVSRTPFPVIATGCFCLQTDIYTEIDESYRSESKDLGDGTLRTYCSVWRYVLLDSWEIFR